jgi:hypothetical protein
MFYKLLGMVVWHGGKFALRRRFGSTHKPLVAGAAVAVIGVLALVAAAAKRNGSED